MSYITAIDFLLIFPYLALLFYLAKRFSKSYAEPELRKHFFIAFWLRMLGSVAYSLVIQFYYGYGDTLGFFKGSDFITTGILENINNVKYLFAPLKEITEWYNNSPAMDDQFAPYFAQPSGNLVMKISSVLGFFAFNRFLIISLFFAFFSFMGQWLLFTVFVDVNKKKNIKLLAIAILYTPSIWFWGSGLMKDSLCLGGLGILVYYMYNVFKKKGNFTFLKLVFTVAIIYMIVTIKFYIIGVTLVALLLTGFLILLNGLKNIVLKIFFLSFLIGASIFTFINLDFSVLINEAIEESVAQIHNFQNMYEAISAEDQNSKGAFTFGEIDPSIAGIVSKAPSAVFSCLYRPFVWESKKIMILFTSLESLALLLFSLYLLFKTKVFFFFKAIFSNEFIFFSFVLSILFALVIGFTTFNFGTMIRYKIIFLPFFYFILVYIYSNYVQKEKNCT